MSNHAKPIARAICILVLCCVAGIVHAVPHESIEQLAGQVEVLAAQKVLTAGQDSSLGVKLRHAADALQRGNAKSSIQRLVTFETEVTGLARSGVLPQKDGGFLISLAESTRHEISQLSFGLPDHLVDGIQICFSDAGCEYSVVYVDAAAQGKPDGSSDRPFQSIAQALVHALSGQACGVELRLAPGTYREDVYLPMHLKLHGVESGAVIVGSIVNYDGWVLDVKRLKLHSSAPPGAIVIDSACPSKTTLSRVSIRNAARYGVFQRGGSLRMSLSNVADTQPEADALSTGSGIYMTGGVRAILGLVNVERSGSSGLVAEGLDTRVYVAASRFADGSVNPYTPAWQESSPRPPAAGIDVRQGALMLMQFTTVSGNELYGLAVRDGGRMHFRYGKVENTRQMPRSHPLGRLGGGNVLGDHATAIELTSFTVENSFAGLLMLASPARATIGTISHHDIGIFLSPEPLDSETVNAAFHCLVDGVTLRNNRRNVDGRLLPFPEGGDPFSEDGDTDPPVCVQVPFDCDWCGL